MKSAVVCTCNLCEYMSASREKELIGGWVELVLFRILKSLKYRIDDIICRRLRLFTSLVTYFSLVEEEVWSKGGGKAANHVCYTRF
jgi:hypothetical protein